MSQLDVETIKKNSNEFSAVKEALNEVNNLEFKAGESDFYRSLLSGNLDTQKSYVWSALSAISDKVGEEIYEKVLNYIDDVSDIDTCDIKALQSMIQILGTNFSVFKSIERCPLEIVKLINIFSMRKDYLLNSDKVCSQLAAAIDKEVLSSWNTDRALSDDPVLSINLERRKHGLSDLSVNSMIKAKELDNLISSTFCNVLSANVYDTYNTIDGQFIYKELSTAILSNGFELSNKYADEIQAAKTKYNIPLDFDPSDEADLIDRGISSLDGYDCYQQSILSIEYKRRREAKNELEPRTRYSYYKEANVRDYFKFIEEEYNELKTTYVNADEYQVDKTYLEISSLGLTQSLATANNNNGIAINKHMIEVVARQLLKVVTTIRGIREYLKSHAQRTYMKGTWLLIAYAINEYLRSNVYPAMNQVLPDSLSITYDSNDTVLRLTEYVDQTQYNNIHTDIREDFDDSTVNPEHWLNNGAEGNADGLDTTNIFRCEDKSKLINVSTFSDSQIQDFYFNVLNVFKLSDADLNLAANKSKLYGFLSAVFSSGADNSYLDEYGKVMCELRNETQTSSVSAYQAGRRFTASTDEFLRELSASYDTAYFMLSGYAPVDNITIQSQLDECLATYKQKQTETYDRTLSNSVNEFQAKIDELYSLLQELQTYEDKFNDLTTQYSTLTSNYLQYTGDFIPSTSTNFNDQLATYSLCVQSGFQFESYAVQSDLITQCVNLQLQYNSIHNLLSSFAKTTTIHTGLSINVSLSYNPISLSITADYGDELLSQYVSRASSYYETLRDAIKAKLNDAIAIMSASLAEAIRDINEYIQTRLNSTDYVELKSLSAILSSYYLDQFSLLSCREILSERLDYTDSDWYKYKKELFLKYTGTKVGHTPYYTIENVKHPSYQIHPCLSNFIEKLDFSYPIGNLAGIAANAISSIATSTAKLCIDADGYLLSVWCNPLNGNSDYLSKYEKTDHTDALGEQNCLFGYDGPFYPEATTDVELSNAAKSLTGDISTSWYKGLNLSDKERAYIYNKLSHLSNIISEVVDNSSADILQYGLDAYGNCYTLIKCKWNTDDEENPVLWIKAKNHPYAFPALMYDSNGFNEEQSFIERNSNEANEEFDKVARCGFNDQISAYPIIDNFSFSTDKTVLLLNARSEDQCHIVPIHVVIDQKYMKDDTHDYYVRSFNIDPTTRQTCLGSPDSEFEFASFYYDRQRIGNIYTCYDRDTEKLSILVDSYLKNEDIIYSTTSALTVLSNIPNEPKVDCQQDGTFSIAYIGDSGITTFKTFANAQADYISAETTDYVDTLSKKIVSYDFQKIGSEILSVDYREFMPYSRIGFIPLLPLSDSSSNRKNILSGTTLQEDLNAGKPMKFELFGQSADQNSGIDFKYLCPMRIYEGSISGHYDVSYHRDNTPSVCYRFEDLHYFEQNYNQYVLSNFDATYFDATELEQCLYISADQYDDCEPNNDLLGDFLKLANRDVQQYLQALRDEDYTTYSDSQFIIDNDVPAGSGQHEFSYITEPYLIPAHYFDSDHISQLSTYLKGYYCPRDAGRTIDSGKFIIGLDSAEISVSWLSNDAGSIKLDFNALHYSTPDDSNVRNKLHKFLNLDRPGDSGYLMIYSSEDGQNKLIYKLFIKNISDASTPRFVMKCLDNDDSVLNNATILGLGVDNNNTVTLLKLEGFETKFIEIS